MRRPFYKHPLFYVPTGLSAVIGLIFLVLFISAAKYVITGHTPAILRIAKFIGRINPNRQVEVVVGLKLRNEKQLDQLLDRQSDPASADFRKFLSTDEFIAQYSPTDEDVAKVTDYLKQQHLTVVDVSKNKVLVRVRGRARDLEGAFAVQLNEYEYGNEKGVINDRDPRVPSDLKDLVACVIGMNDFAIFRNLARERADDGSAPSGLTPGDIATAYGHPNSNNRKLAGKALSGKGVTVAIATAYDYDTKDVQGFWSRNDITRTGTVTKIPVNGTTRKLNIETTLDLQQVGAQAPGADILMYEGSSPSFITFTLVFNQIVLDNNASNCSVSWGMCELTTGQAEMKAEHIIIKQGAAQGIAFFVAAGDSGAYDCSRGKSSTKAPVLSADYPSTDPNVTAVGGTALHLNKDGARNSESVWTGAGGGISVNFDRPTWQKGNGVPGDATKRNTSDVALNADPQTGYSLLYTGKNHVSGGTSFAAPNWTAIWALCEEACGGTRLGPCAPTMYRIGSSSAAYSMVFNDVTEGNNGNGEGPGYPATAAWDHPTGWGTPKVDGLIQWLLHGTPQ
jgi:kumamolisin